MGNKIGLINSHPTLMSSNMERTNFLSLPLELRCIVYDMYLYDNVLGIMHSSTNLSKFYRPYTQGKLCALLGPLCEAVPQVKNEFLQRFYHPSNNIGLDFHNLLTFEETVTNNILCPRHFQPDIWVELEQRTDCWFRHLKGFWQELTKELATLEWSTSSGGLQVAIASAPFKRFLTGCEDEEVKVRMLSESWADMMDSRGLVEFRGADWEACVGGGSFDRFGVTFTRCGGNLCRLKWLLGEQAVGSVASSPASGDASGSGTVATEELDG